MEHCIHVLSIYSLSVFDDKRFLLQCLKHSVPYGSILARKYAYRKCPFCKKNYTI